MTLKYISFSKDTIKRHSLAVLGICFLPGDYPPLGINMIKKNLFQTFLSYLPAIIALGILNCNVANRIGESDGSPAAPVSLNYNTITHGKTDGFYSSFYVYYSPAALTPYSVSLTSITIDVDLYTYKDDNTFVTTDCSSTQPGTTDELCNTSSGIASAVYIEVYPFGGVTGTYDILIK